MQLVTGVRVSWLLTVGFIKRWRQLALTYSQLVKSGSFNQFWNFRQHGSSSKMFHWFFYASDRSRTNANGQKLLTFVRVSRHSARSSFCPDPFENLSAKYLAHLLDVGSQRGAKGNLPWAPDLGPQMGESIKYTFTDLKKNCAFRFCPTRYFASGPTNPHDGPV